MRYAVTVVLAVWLLVGAFAQAAGDAAAGKDKAHVCVACHGADGNSVNPEWPKLAGQLPAYIVTQLENFKQGVRKNPLMAPIAQALSKQDMLDLAAYFGSQELKLTGAKDAELAQEGEHLYRGGNAQSQIAACIGCHGPTGSGVPPRFPRLSGQHAAYTKQQLLAFKAGNRVSDGDIMTSIAFRMSEKEIDAVAEYVSGLH